MPDSEEQLKLYRLLVEHSLGLMCIHDLNGVLLSINPAAAQTLGYTPKECLGRSIRFGDERNGRRHSRTRSALWSIRRTYGKETPLQQP